MKDLEYYKKYQKYKLKYQKIKQNNMHGGYFETKIFKNPIGINNILKKCLTNESIVLIDELDKISNNNPQDYINLDNINKNILPTLN